MARGRELVRGCKCTDPQLMADLEKDFGTLLFARPSIDTLNPGDEEKLMQVFTFLQVVEYARRHMRGPSCIDATVEHEQNVIHRNGEGGVGGGALHRCHMKELFVPLKSLSTPPITAEHLHWPLL